MVGRLGRWGKGGSDGGEAGKMGLCVVTQGHVGVLEP